MTDPDLAWAVTAEVEETRTDRGPVSLIRLLDTAGRTVALFVLSPSMRLKRLPVPDTPEPTLDGIGADLDATLKGAK
jgi:hypothetical protein